MWSSSGPGSSASPPRASWLRRNPDARVLVLEREPDIAAHQTSHNSGVVHAGIYYAPGSLKAQLCTEGRGKLYAYCDEHGIAYEKCGKLIVALNDEELVSSTSSSAVGSRTASRACADCSGSEIPEIEPHAVGVAALHSPETGIVDFAAVARSLAAEIRERGRDDPDGRGRLASRALAIDHRRPHLRRRRSPPPAPSPAPASGPIAWPSPPASPTTSGSSRSAAATCASAPMPGRWSAA